MWHTDVTSECVKEIRRSFVLNFQN